MTGDERIASFGIGTGGARKMADERGYVTLLLTGRRIRYRMCNPRPGRRPQRGKAAELRHQRHQRRGQAAMARAINKINRDAQVAEIAALLERMAAEGLIQKVGPDLYQANPPTLAERMAARRNEARSMTP